MDTMDRMASFHVVHYINEGKQDDQHILFVFIEKLIASFMIVYTFVDHTSASGAPTIKVQAGPISLCSSDPGPGNSLLNRLYSLSRIILIWI